MILSAVFFPLKVYKFKSQNTNFSIPPFLYPITGIPHAKAFRAESQKVSKNSDGIKQ